MTPGRRALTPSSAALTLLIVVAWLATHQYLGLSQDARIYALQALARLNPELRSDIYLQNTSQDQFTIFSPFYAFFIQRMGLAGAARFLTLAFTGWFLVAALATARSLFGRKDAWLALAFLILAAGTYGAYHVFRFDEEYLTARLPAEALVATGVALFHRGHRYPGLSLALVALFIHPIMALPGVIFLVYLTLSSRSSVGLSILGVLAALSMASIGHWDPHLRPPFELVDADWLDVVRERSQFLFLQYWSLHDWETTTRMFLSLAVSAVVLQNPSVRRLCFTAALVGASGLLVASIAGTIGPMAILLQGQAWRWLWITAFVSALLLGPTLIVVYRDQTLGPMVALLLVAAWTIPELSPALCATGALALCFLKPVVRERTALYLRWTALIAAILIAILPVYKLTLALGTQVTPPGMSTLEAGFRAVPSLKYLLAGAVAMMWYWLIRPKAWSRDALAGAALLLLATALARSAFDKASFVGTAEQIAAAPVWQRAIPPSSNVYVADGIDASTFAWFTLSRPSYLSLDQSAGVVFSRETALEIKRRSETLLPLMTEDWKLMSRLKTSGGRDPKARAMKPLTPEGLANICADPELDFLISRDDVTSAPSPTKTSNHRQQWRLYDCRKVREVARPA